METHAVRWTRLSSSTLAFVGAVLAPSIAHASGGAGYAEGFLFVLLLAPFGALVSVLCVGLALFARSGTRPRAAAVLRVVSIGALVVSALIFALGIAVGVGSGDWLDWAAIYVVCAGVVAACGAFGLRSSRRIAPA